MSQPTIQNPGAAKALALAKAKAAAQAAQTSNPAAIQRFIPAGECKDRIRIIFDDSGSMHSEIKNAKEGVTEFLRNCVPNQTSVAIHFLETQNAGAAKLSALNSNLIEIATTLKELQVIEGGTPLFKTLKSALDSKPQSTRLVVFTDGQPTDTLREASVPSWGTPEYTAWNKVPQLDRWKLDADIIITQAKECSNPIDTVFFGNAEYNQDEINLLKYFSERTGGYFLHFDPSKPNIWKQMKYLAPINRLALASESVRKEVESGQRT